MCVHEVTVTRAISDYNKRDDNEAENIISRGRKRAEPISRCRPPSLNT